MPAAKKPRVDAQMTGLSGELFVAAELLRRGIQTSVTLSRAKSIDLLAYNPRIETPFTVQVKSLRNKTYFPIRPGDVKARGNRRKPLAQIAHSERFGQGFGSS